MQPTPMQTRRPEWSDYESGSALDARSPLSTSMGKGGPRAFRVTSVYGHVDYREASE